MKRPIRAALIGLLVLPLLLVALVNSLAVDPAEAPPPDPGLLITLPDGSEVPLGELVEQASAPETADDGLGLELVDGATAAAPDETAAPSPAEVPDVSEMSDEEAAAFVREVLERARRDADNPAPDDLLGLARLARREGRLDQAVALYRSIPPDHHSYARAQRQLGWKLYTQEMHEPTRGIAHVNASVAADPMDGNAWQDLVRVYGSSLGLPLD